MCFTFVVLALRFAVCTDCRARKFASRRIARRVDLLVDWPLRFFCSRSSRSPSRERGVVGSSRRLVSAFESSGHRVNGGEGEEEEEVENVDPSAAAAAAPAARVLSGAYNLASSAIVSVCVCVCVLAR